MGQNLYFYLLTTYQMCVFIFIKVLIFSNRWYTFVDTNLVNLDTYIDIKIYTIHLLYKEGTEDLKIC